MAETIIYGGGVQSGKTDAAHKDGTNEPGSNGVAPEAPPKPRGERSRHYDRLAERMEDDPSAVPTNQGTKKIEQWFDENEDES